MGGDAESTRTDDYVGIRELAPSRNGQRRVRETDGTRLHNVVLSDVHSPAARAHYRRLWNTRYIEPALKQLEQRGLAVRPEDGARIWPLGFQHSHMLGRYAFDLPRDCLCR